MGMTEAKLNSDGGREGSPGRCVRIIRKKTLRAAQRLASFADRLRGNYGNCGNQAMEARHAIV